MAPKMVDYLAVMMARDLVESMADYSVERMDNHLAELLDIQ